MPSRELIISLYREISSVIRGIDAPILSTKTGAPSLDTRTLSKKRLNFCFKFSNLPCTLIKGTPQFICNQIYRLATTDTKPGQKKIRVG